MHDKDCSADGALTEESDAETKRFSPLDIIPCMAVKLPPDVIKLPRAVHACLLSPELLSVSVPAAPNISYQWFFPNIDRPIPEEYTDGVRCIITVGPNAIARIRMNIISTQHTAYCCQSFQGGISCCYRPNVVGRFLDARRLPLPTRTVITF